MAITNNIFAHAKKELSTDAFLAWLFVELDTNAAFKPYLAPLFSRLGLVRDGEVPHLVHVRPQKERVDLLLDFKVGEEPRQVLFENKVHTTHHSGQLETYAGIFKGATCVYYKLGYVDVAERAYVTALTEKKPAYAILSAKDMYEALSIVLPNSLPLRTHPFIEHYLDYLKTRFIEPQAEILAGVERSDASVFSRGMAQKIVLGRLYDALTEMGSPDFKLSFKAGTNAGGMPRAILSFCRRVMQEGEPTETIWWRMDKRERAPYLRISQYWATDKKNIELAGRKQARVKQLRELVAAICHQYPLALSKPSNRIGNETELAILFFKDNRYAAIKELLPEITARIQNGYRDLNVGIA